MASVDSDPTDNLVWFSRFSLYSCDQNFTCADKRFTFDDGYFVYGHYIDDHIAYFVGHKISLNPDGTLNPEDQDFKVWRAVDGGEVEPWESIEQMIPNRLDHGPTIVASALHHDRYFMLISVRDSRRILRSDDAGASWKRLPNGPSSDSLIDLQALPDGRLFVIDEQRPLCSVDEGKTWAPFCP